MTRRATEQTLHVKKNIDRARCWASSHTANRPVADQQCQPAAKRSLLLFQRPQSGPYIWASSHMANRLARGESPWRPVADQQCHPRQHWRSHPAREFACLSLAS